MAPKSSDKMRLDVAAINIQKNLRRHVARKTYEDLRSPKAGFESSLRAMAALDCIIFRKQREAAILIQACWRCHRDHTYYKNLQKAVLVSQHAWRRRLARRELRKIRMAARETRILIEARDNLTKHVEELTLHLQLEKLSRIDMEEAKDSEIAKLHEMLQGMQLQVEEAKSTVFLECEVARKAFEEAHIEKIYSLTAEVEQLKASFLIKEAARNFAYAIAQKRNTELLKKVEDTVMEVDQLQHTLIKTLLKVDQIQDNIKRLEEKISDLKTQNQVCKRSKWICVILAFLGVVLLSR